MSGSISRSDTVQAQCGRFGAVIFTAPFLFVMTVLLQATHFLVFGLIRNDDLFWAVGRTLVPASLELSPAS